MHHREHEGHEEGFSVSAATVDIHRFVARHFVVTYK